MSFSSQVRLLRKMVSFPFGKDLVEYNFEKAMERVSSKVEHAQDPVSSFYDPLMMMLGQNWINRGSLHRVLDFSTLRELAENPVIGSIVMTRLNQMAAFCHISKDSYEPGIVVKKSLDSPVPESKLPEAQGLLMTAGVRGYGERSLETLLRKTMRDSLILDQLAAEIVPRRDGLPAYLVAVDAATIRRLKNSLSLNEFSDDDCYVQVMNEMIVTRYSQNSLFYGVRNPLTDIRAGGYGVSELELLVRTITSILNAERYNAISLSQGGTKKGLLVVKGEVDNVRYNQFKKDFRDAVGNASKGWKPPILTMGKDSSIDWLQLDHTNRDMEYNTLFTFLIQTATSVYQIAPEEVNWQIGNSGANVQFNSGVGDRLDASKSKGLVPLLRFFGDLLTSHFIDKLYPGFYVDFTGIGESRDSQIERKAKEVSSFKLVNEVRVEMGLPPIAGGDIILSQVYTSSLQGQNPSGDGNDWTGYPGAQ